jgi:hypothetical protein
MRRANAGGIGLAHDWDHSGADDFAGAAPLLSLAGCAVD